MSKRSLQLIEKVLIEAQKLGNLELSTLTSFRWYSRKVKQAIKKEIKPRDFHLDTERKKIRPILGEMYHFYYDPLTKDKLSYYDRFPLVIPIRRKPGGFLGLNLHYLDHKHRAILFNRLQDFLQVDPESDVKLIKTKYRMLAASARYKYFRPCLKRYYYSNMKGKFIRIDPAEWNVVIFLPTERFMKAKFEDVWELSKEQIV